MTRLTDDQIGAAADILLALREQRLALGALPAELTPENTADVQRIIDVVSAQVDRPIYGWKTYIVYKPMNPPVYAPIYDRFLTGAEIPAATSPRRLIEPEIMFRVDRELPARDRSYDVDEVQDAVTAVVGFEVIGSRFRVDSSSDGGASNGQGSLYGSLADHLANGGIVVGDAIPDWQAVAFEDVQLRLTEDDAELISTIGCHPFDNPFLPVVVGVNRLRRHHGASAGDIIVTNSSTSFVPARAGSVIRACYEGLGEVTATFAPAAARPPIR
jgi:2-keto-4-pentenoate hydratase